MESTLYVISFRMVFFYLVTTGWIFYISLRENSINQSNYSLTSSVLCILSLDTIKKTIGAKCQVNKPKSELTWHLARWLNYNLYKKKKTRGLESPRYHPKVVPRLPCISAVIAVIIIRIGPFVMEFYLSFDPQPIYPSCGHRVASPG